MEYAKSFGENVLFHNTNNEMRGGYPDRKSACRERGEISGVAGS